MKFMHFLEVATKMVLAVEDKHPWEMVNSLERFHFHQAFRLNSAVAPTDIPFISVFNVGFIWKLHVKYISCNILNNLIFCVHHIHHQSFALLFLLLQPRSFRFRSRLFYFARFKDLSFLFNNLNVFNVRFRPFLTDLVLDFLFFDI